MDTFVIRVWIPADVPTAEGVLDMRGIVEHVADGKLMVFEDAAELLEFLRGPEKS